MTTCTHLVIAGVAVLSALTAVQAQAAEVAYISSSSGYVLGGNGNASTANWSGQPPMRGFGGYGAIQMNGKCLAGRTGNQPLTWEACRGDAAQKWALSNKKLNNELGWCADVQGNRAGAGVPVLAYKCSGAINQQWNTHTIISAQAAAALITNPAVKATFLQTASTAPVGAVISKSTGKVISNDGGSLVASGGGNLVASGGGNLVASGGGN